LHRERHGGRWASAYIFYGPVGIGKRLVAEWFLQSFACQSAEPRPCGSCPACQQWQHRNYPDYHCLGTNEAINVSLTTTERRKRAAGKKSSEISVEMVNELCRELTRRPLASAGHLIVIDEAERLNKESANALLKTLEEPRGRPIIVMLTSRFHRMLSTIRSRCRAVRFGMLSRADLELGMQRLDIAADALAIELAGGSLGRLQKLTDPAQAEIRHVLCSYLAGETDSWWEALGCASGGKGDVARERVRDALEVALFWYQALLRARSGASLPEGLQDYTESIRRAALRPARELEEAQQRILCWLGRLDSYVNPRAVLEGALLRG